MSVTCFKALALIGIGLVLHWTVTCKMPWLATSETCGPCGPVALHFFSDFWPALAGSLADIDYIVINHAEEDHAGALTELMAQIPDTPIYCTNSRLNLWSTVSISTFFSSRMR